MAVSAPSAVQAVAAARLALAEALLLKPGQVVQAVVVGKTPAGLTTLKIGDQLVQAQLPQSLPAGTTLQLAVKTGGATPQLVVVSQTLPGQTSAVVPQPIAVTPLPLLPEGSVAAERLVLVTQPVVAEARTPIANGESVQRVVPQILRGESGTAAVVATPVAAAKGAVVVNAPVARAPVVAVAQATVQGAVVQAPATTAVVATAPPVAPAAAAASAPQAGPSTVTAPAVPPVAGEAVVRQLLAAAGVPLPVAGGVAEVVATPGQTVVAQAAPLPTGERPQVVAAPQIAVPAPVAAEAPIPVVSPQPQVAASVPNAPEAEAQASSPLLVAQAAIRPQATMLDLPRAVVPAVVAQPAATPAPQPATPQAALAQMVPEALARQDSVGPLLNSLAAVVQKAAVLPEPVLRAALGVLAQRIVATDGKVVAADLERAVVKSGVFLEATLAKALPQIGDAKSGLLVLRDALSKWLGDAPAMSAGRDAAPPPLKGLPLRAPAATLPPLPDAPRDVARALHGQADAAVSRTKLMQMASLPDGDMARPANAPVRMELPFLIGHELVMAQIQIARDGSRREAERKRGWTMRFALNFSATGEVGAEVGLLGKAVNVALWAAEPETAEAMQAALPELGAALEAIGLDPGSIRIRQGAPEPEKAVSGRLLDSVS